MADRIAKLEFPAAPTLPSRRARRRLPKHPVDIGRVGEGQENGATVEEHLRAPDGSRPVDVVKA